jgi:flagellar basal body-associated protein FliL
MSIAEPRPSVILTVAAFLAVAGAFGAGLVISLHHEAPSQTVVEPVEASPEEMMKAYYPFPEDIYITRPDRTMVFAAVSFYLEGPPMDLMALQEVAKSRQSEVQAALLAAAQTQAERSADLAAFRADLPVALLAQVNEMLGTTEDPTPIKEVLLTKFIAR